jgi:hypothetical protein
MLRNPRDQLQVLRVDAKFKHDDYNPIDHRTRHGRPGNAIHLDAGAPPANAASPLVTGAPTAAVDSIPGLSAAAVPPGPAIVAMLSIQLSRVCRCN